jgi:hypothetical protein
MGRLMRSAIFISTAISATLFAALYLAPGASASGLHDYYQSDDESHQTLLEAMKAWKVPALPRECAGLAAEGKIVNRFQIKVGGKIAKTWHTAKSSDGHGAEDATQAALFESGLGGHPPSLNRGNLEHPGNTSKQAPSRGEGIKVGFGIGGSVLSDLQKFSMLCRGHLLGDAKPKATPRIDIIRKRGAAAVSEFGRRAKAAKQTEDLLKALEEEMGQTLAVIQQKGDEACKAALKSWDDEFKESVEGVESLRSQAAEAREQYEGQKKAYEGLLSSADDAAKTACKE